MTAIQREKRRFEAAPDPANRDQLPRRFIPSSPVSAHWAGRIRRKADDFQKNSRNADGWLRGTVARVELVQPGQFDCRPTVHAQLTFSRIERTGKGGISLYDSANAAFAKLERYCRTCLEREVQFALGITKYREIVLDGRRERGAEPYEARRRRE